MANPLNWIGGIVNGDLNNAFNDCNVVTNLQEVQKPTQVTKYQDVTKYRDETRYRDVTKYRTETRYRDVTKTRPVIKHATLIKQWTGSCKYYFKLGEA